MKGTLKEIWKQTWEELYPAAIAGGVVLTGASIWALTLPSDVGLEIAFLVLSLTLLVLGLRKLIRSTPSGS